VFEVGGECGIGTLTFPEMALAALPKLSLSSKPFVSP
jgi:hypothetical protein